MNVPKRYFLNNLKDYHLGEELKINSSKWKDRISEDISAIVQHQPPSSKDCDGGLYVGCSGVGYMMYHVSKSATFEEEREGYVKQGLKYMNVALQHVSHTKDNKSASAFLLGNSGVYAVSAALYAAAGMKDVAEDCISEYVSSSSLLKRHKPSSDELFVGRAGFLAGALWLNKVLGKGTVPVGEIRDMCGWIVESGRKYSAEHKSPCPLMYSYYDTEYLGAAHGLCSILQMLLSCPEFLHSDQRASNEIRSSVDYLLSLQTSTGNFPCALDEVKKRRRSEEDELVHWCHGGPGVVYAMAKAYIVWGDEKYLRSCIACGELVWNKGLLKKGPGICHGIAGSGYVFLLLYRLTGDMKHLHRAQQFADFIYSSEFKHGARVPDCPHSLYEGLAGTVCFLVDMLAPDTASFPFQDVF